MSLLPNHSVRRGAARVGSAAVLTAGVLVLTGCGQSSHSAQTTTSTSTKTAAPASTSSAPAAAGGNQPIGSAGIDLGSGSSSIPPAAERSGDLATDCYKGGDRIYDRYGVSCSAASTVLAAYEASAQSAKGAQTAVSGYQCSHNPTVMVVQGAAPGKCIDGNGNVVFNWRYPGAPLPDH